MKYALMDCEGDTISTGDCLPELPTLYNKFWCGNPTTRMGFWTGSVIMVQRPTADGTIWFATDKFVYQLTPITDEE